LIPVASRSLISSFRQPPFAVPADADQFIQFFIVSRSNHAPFGDRRRRIFAYGAMDQIGQRMKRGGVPS
jgi:hypothetical protein